MPAAFVGIGSNLRPEENLGKALRLLSGEGLFALSTIYRTEPLERPGQPLFLNCVAGLKTERPPVELKAALRDIEASLGRVRTDDRHAPRPIDLDLISYGDARLEEDGLVLPDPEIETRPFIAIPLFEIAPDALTPSGAPLEEVVRSLPAIYMEPLTELSKRIRKEIFK
ncbi:MAG: 2-amino-4-hydroxy-6-hydroxymethyldihydropteridine diphosphokinase [Deltaproteobacteria bacterium]|nr:2-amino-4-hydroxy-6-hydroxymethyldihydropteridine diphosphokinase [Deltaproteobacteria bacterium]MCL4873747.1 2-amino-4-hydroxy-6-hydroxymethyldihydropteridine diphosphokinase [bacterium]